MQIKTNKRFSFIDNPEKFIKSDVMISATKLTYGNRRFVLSLCHRPQHSKETKELFKKGIQAHEEMQIGIPDINEFGYLAYRKALHKHKTVRLKELEVISPKYALYGIIDVLSVTYTKDGDILIEIDELKSRFSNKHYIQMIAYCLILSDLNAKLVYGRPYKRKEGEKRVTGYLYPDPEKIRNISINGRVFIIYNQKNQPYLELIKNSEFIGGWAEIQLGIKKKLKDFQQIMRNKVFDLSSIPHDSDKRCCKDFSHICPKIDYLPKTKQRYISPKTLNIIKTRPKQI